MRRTILVVIIAALAWLTPAWADPASEVLALERQAMDGWLIGDPAPQLAITDSQITYFHAVTEKRLEGLPALRELYEAGPWVDAQVLSPAALQWLCRDLERIAGDDAGVGAPEVRRQLREVLRADLSQHSQDRRDSVS